MVGIFNEHLPMKDAWLILVDLAELRNRVYRQKSSHRNHRTERTVLSTANPGKLAVKISKSNCWNICKICDRLIAGFSVAVDPLCRATECVSRSAQLGRQSAGSHDRTKQETTTLTVLNSSHCLSTQALSSYPRHGNNDQPTALVVLAMGSRNLRGSFKTIASRSRVGGTLALV